LDAVNFILGFIPSNVETLFIQMPRVIVNDHREQGNAINCGSEPARDDLKVAALTLQTSLFQLTDAPPMRGVLRGPANIRAWGSRALTGFCA
jgi:hypothetical protein